MQLGTAIGFSLCRMNRAFEILMANAASLLVDFSKEESDGIGRSRSVMAHITIATIAESPLLTIS